MEKRYQILQNIRLNRKDMAKDVQTAIMDEHHPSERKISRVFEVEPPNIEELQAIVFFTSYHIHITALRNKVEVGRTNRVFQCQSWYKNIFTFFYRNAFCCPSHLLLSTLLHFSVKGRLFEFVVFAEPFIFISENLSGYRTRWLMSLQRKAVVASPPPQRALPSYTSKCPHFPKIKYLYFELTYNFFALTFKGVNGNLNSYLCIVS